MQVAMTSVVLKIGPSPLESTSILLKFRLSGGAFSASCLKVVPVQHFCENLIPKGMNWKKDKRDRLSHILS